MNNAFVVSIPLHSNLEPELFGLKVLEPSHTFFFVQGITYLLDSR